MTASARLERMLELDFDALGEETAESAPDFRETAQMLSSSAGPYRDGGEGARARREHLLALRRRDLALMPLRTARIFVHRVARASAGAVALLAGVVLSANLLGASVASVALSSLVMATLLCIAATYVIASHVAEHLFEGRVQQSLPSTDDPYEDIEVLANSAPMIAARRLIRAVDSLSVALPLCGLAVLAPLMEFLLLRGFYGFAPSLGSSLPFLLPVAALFADIGAVIGWLCYRELRHADSPQLEALESKGVIAVIAGLCVLAPVVIAPWLAQYSAAGSSPGPGARWFLAFVGIAVVFAPASWVLLRIRRRENSALDDAV